MSKPVRHYDKWRIRWVDSEGRRKSEVYATCDDAKFALRRHQQEVEEIKRGLRLPELPDKRSSDLRDYWLTKRALLKRSAKDDISIIGRHLRPQFGALRIRDVRVERIDQFVAEKCHLHKKTVANHLTLLMSMLSLAVELGWLLKTPKIRKPRNPLFTKDYRNLRTDEKIFRFLRAARREGDDVFALYATAIYTGMRAGELAGLQWGKGAAISSRAPLPCSAARSSGVCGDQRGKRGLRIAQLFFFLRLAVALGHPSKISGSALSPFLDPRRGSSFTYLV